MSAFGVVRHCAPSNKVKAFAVAACIALAAGGALAKPAQDAGPPQKPWKEGRLLVQARAGLADSDFDRIVQGKGGKWLQRLTNLDVQVIEVPAGAEDALAEALAKDPRIKIAEKDLLVEPSAASNDPYFSWHLNTIQAPAAWGSAPGSGVTVAVLDSGVDAAQPDLAGQLVAGRNVVVGTADTSDTSPINAHGTNVAGVIAALTNNGWGVASIAWGAKVMPVRVTDRSDGWAYSSDLANGIVWAADHGAQVANVSYDVGNGSVLSVAAQYMRGKGGIVVAAAGNSGVNPGLEDNPYVTSVSATDSADNLASFSSFGNYVDLSAPGVDLLTTGPSAQVWKVWGTSFSSPTVAAVAALAMAVNPTLTPDEVESVLEQSADDLGAPGWDPQFGHGRVNAAAAVDVALAMYSVPPDSQPPAVAIGSPASGAAVSGSVNVNLSASDNQSVTQVMLYAGNTLVGTDTTAPYGFTWDSKTQADGTVVLTADAYDAAGNLGTSAPVSIVVHNAPPPVDTTPPTARITSPANGATVSGTVGIQASGSDNVHVARLELWLDGTKVSSVNGASISYSWNTRKASSGSHSISAVAVDDAGNRATAAISVKLGSTVTSVRKK